MKAVRPTRRRFIQNAMAGLAGMALGSSAGRISAQVPGDRPKKAATKVRILNPRNRVPVSLIIDDSTCLVNMAHFGIPQFAEVFPDRYTQPWKTLPREIPDSFVRKFGEWCRENGVKGKYSMVPYPACVGWLDRDLPGWSKKELEASLGLVRTLIVPDWDIHPEMVSHTWVINTRTGRPYEERSERFMENWGWASGRSVDELADYLGYALRILKNVGLSCGGITTPGGFGNGAESELSRAVLESCRTVFNTEIPHYFKHVFTDGTSVRPRVENATGIEGSDPGCVVSMIGCTDDWFGNWDGLHPGSADRFITRDFQSGRLVDVIQRNEPALLVCHWPGIYFNGQETGFKIFKEVVKRLHSRFSQLMWMKLSEIARYWAARELTGIRETGKSIEFNAPFSTPYFTVEMQTMENPRPELVYGGNRTPLTRIVDPLKIQSGTYAIQNQTVIVSFDLPKGKSKLILET